MSLTRDRPLIFNISADIPCQAETASLLRMDADVTVFAVLPICQYLPWAQTLGRHGPCSRPEFGPWPASWYLGHSGPLHCSTLGGGGLIWLCRD